MMKKGKAFMIDLVIYPFDVLVSIGQTNEEVGRRICQYAWLPESRKELEDIINMDETTNGRVVKTSCNRVVLRLKKYPTKPIDHGYIAHEVFHAATFLMDTIGHKLVVGERDEPHAYLIDYITRKIYERL